MKKDDKRYPWMNRYKMLSLLASLLLLTACTVTLLSGYNAELITTLTKLQKQINTLLITIKQAIGTKQAAYQPYKKQYNIINVELISLLTKLKAIPQNDITVKQGEPLQKTINALQKLHKRGFHHAQEVMLIQQTINDEFLAIFKLQYAKKTYLK